VAKTLKIQSPAPWRVFIVEDHPVFREGLAQTLASDGDLLVCGKAGNAEQALEAIAQLKPDLVLVDITLPGKSGLELVKELRAVDRRIKLLIVSMHDEALYADRVLRAGGDGYIMKQEDPEEIVHAIRDVLSGHIYVSEAVLADMRNGSNGSVTPAHERKDDPLADLTDTELEVLELLGRGKTNREIAKQMRLSPRQVTAQCGKIRKKLKLPSTNALIRYAVCWVEAGEG
jgi:DNA-binding NarL/FixJ family response regulator